MCRLIRRTLLSAGLLNLRCNSDANQSVVRLELLQGLGRVVDQGESGGLSTTELRLETENVDLVLAGLVEFGQLASEVVLGDVGTVGVEDVTTGSLESRSPIHGLALPRKVLEAPEG
jgi:hypothetical protein